MMIGCRYRILYRVAPKTLLTVKYSNKFADTGRGSFRLNLYTIVADSRNKKDESRILMRSVVLWTTWKPVAISICLPDLRVKSWRRLMLICPSHLSSVHLLIALYCRDPDKNLRNCSFRLFNFLKNVRIIDFTLYRVIHVDGTLDV